MSGAAAPVGSLSMLGIGMRWDWHLTFECLRELKAADVVLFYGRVAPALALLRMQNRNVVDLIAELVDEGDTRDKTYDRMKAEAMRRVRAGERVVFATYGSAAVGVDVTLELGEWARREGFDFRVLPAVSSLECLFCDLAIDPLHGVTVIEASRLLVDRPTIDTRYPLIIAQAEFVGSAHHPWQTHDRMPAFAAFKRFLLGTYGADHELIVYEAPVFRDDTATIKRLTVGELKPGTYGPEHVWTVLPADRTDDQRPLQAWLSAWAMVDPPSRPPTAFPGIGAPRTTVGDPLGLPLTR